MPLIYLDTFLIRKGNGVFNIHEFIQAFLQANSVDNGYALLDNSHHDLNHEEFSGVEADAVKLGISRALLSSNENYKNSLRKYSLLTVDSRNKERKKYGQKGARRKFQFVKR